MEYHVADLERAERRFREDIWSCAPPDAVSEAGVQARHFGPVLATAFADLPEAPRMNTILGAAEPGAVSDGHFGEAVEWMREWEVDFQVSVAAERPGTELAETWLDWHGCEQGAVMRQYVRAAGAPAARDAPGVEVHKLPPAAEEGLDCLITEGFDLPFMAGFLFLGLPCLPGWHCYFAYLEDEVVACGSMRIENGIAKLGLDATLEHARGHGCQSALLRRRLRDAAAAGCHTAIARSRDDPARGGSAASRNLRRAGFAEAYRSVVWLPPVGITVG